MMPSVTSWGRYDIINTSSNCHFGGRTENDVAMTSWGHDDIIDDVISGQIEVSRGASKKSPVFRVEEAELLRVIQIQIDGIRPGLGIPAGSLAPGQLAPG